MNIQPVTLDPGFQFLEITRSGGFAGMVDRVRIDPTLTAHVEHSSGQSAKFDVDARQAEHVLHALANHVGVPVTSNIVGGGDMYQYDIELGWHGTIYRIHCVGLASDEAVHGAVSLADSLFSESMTTHEHTSETSATHAANGNPGIVPLWLRDGSQEQALSGTTT